MRDKAPFCMPGMTLLVPIFAVLSTPHATLSVIALSFPRMLAGSQRQPKR